MTTTMLQDFLFRATVASGVLLGSVIPVPHAFGNTATILSTKDNSLYQASGTPQLSNALGAGIFVGKTNNGQLRRGLVYFNIAGALPAGSTVTAVTMRLRCTRNNAVNELVTIHKLNREFGEATSLAAGEGGMGADATAGDATWRYAQFPTVLWTSQGGDFVAAPGASKAVGASGSWYGFDGNASMVTQVQQMLDAPATNFGFLIKGPETQSDNSAKRFASREDLDGYTPQLIVTFTPGAACNDVDFNNDGVFPDTGDLEDFLSVFGGGLCSNDPTCDTIDFNNDGVFPDSSDIEAFLRVLGGGAC